VHVLYRDVLGLAALDTVKKSVQLRFPDLDLDRCEGALPTLDGQVELSWRKDGATLRYRLRLPAGYTATVDNRSRLALVKEP
jgi:alpha-L-rhamnosidase